MPAYPKSKQTKHTKTEKPKSHKKISITKLDYWFSLCVRERANWTCQKCGKAYPPTLNEKGLPGNRALHCSHFVGRGNDSVRTDPLNAEAHCYGCHSFFEQNPIIFSDYIKEVLGEKFEILMEKSRNPMLGKQMNKERQQAVDHYKTQFFKIRDSNNKEFEGYL